MLFHFLAAQYLRATVVAAFIAMRQQLRSITLFRALAAVDTIGKMLFRPATSAIT
jgi:hypothetical protein